MNVEKGIFSSNVRETCRKISELKEQLKMIKEGLEKLGCGEMVCQTESDIDIGVQKPMMVSLIHTHNLEYYFCT